MKNLFLLARCSLASLSLPPQPRIGSFAFTGFSLDPGMIARALHIQGGAELG